MNQKPEKETVWRKLINKIPEPVRIPAAIGVYTYAVIRLLGVTRGQEIMTPLESAVIAGAAGVLSGIIIFLDEKSSKEKSEE